MFLDFQQYNALIVPSQYLILAFSTYKTSAIPCFSILNELKPWP